MFKVGAKVTVEYTDSNRDRTLTHDEGKPVRLLFGTVVSVNAFGLYSVIDATGPFRKTFTGIAEQHITSRTKTKQS